MKLPSSFVRKTLIVGLLGLGLIACVFKLESERPDIDPQRWWDGRGPVVPHEAFPSDCQLCHEGNTWESIRDDFEFDHLAETGVALEGAHLQAECLRCHNDRGPVSMFSSQGCAGCHEDVHRNQLGQNCQDCHDALTWKPQGQITLHAQTRFPLIGAHAATACYRCHEGAQVGEFTRTDIECATCHQSDLALALNPDHVAQGWVADCDRCHIPTAWTGAAFNHNTFPLTGAHSSANCADCHVGEVFAGTSSTCVDCHQAEFDATSDPNHLTAGFSTSCQDCHTTSAWAGAGFTHLTFPLSGAHVAADCSDCHTGSVFAGTPSDCVDCHQSEYNATTDPDHASSGFPTSCQDCHGTVGWDGAAFTHDMFPLTGAHLAVTCTDCHLGGIFTNASPECSSCHQADYDSTTDPNHQAAGFPLACQTCHGTSTWDGAVFNHTSFALVGAHVAASCTDCHTGGVYVGLPSDCSDCHQSDYDGTSDPNHQAAGFSLACDSCHGNSTWNGAVFNHTSFPLTGAHVSASCSECHIGNVFAGLPSECIDCHSSDYNSTNDPNHAAAGFPVSCQSCHNTSTWNGATFNHSFPINSGAHKNLSCTDCHMAPSNFNVFACINCHEHNKSDTDKDHDEVSGYSYDSPSCYSCHPNGK